MKQTRVLRDSHTFAHVRNISKRNVNYTLIDIFNHENNEKQSLSKAKFKERFAYEKCYSDEASKVMRQLAYQIRQLRYDIDRYCSTDPDLWDFNCEDAEREIKIVLKKLKQIIYDSQRTSETESNSERLANNQIKPQIKA